MRSNPIHGVRIPARIEEEPDERAKALTAEELRLVLAALPEGWRLFFEFLTHTGLRISEAIGLRWEHLDLGRRPRVLVREQVYNGKRKRLKSKDGRRDVPLSAAMAERLRARRRDHFTGEDAPVWTTEAGTELSRPNLAGRVLKPAAKAAGLTVERDGDEVAWVSFHTFRHTCASLLFAEGRKRPTGRGVAWTRRPGLLPADLRPPARRRRWRCRLPRRSDRRGSRGNAWGNTRSGNGCKSGRGRNGGISRLAGETRNGCKRLQALALTQG